MPATVSPVPMSEAMGRLRRELNLSPLCHIGFIVPDLELAMAHYAPLFGPFMRRDIAMRGALYHGVAEDYEMKLAYTDSGSMEIELIQWVSGEGPHKDFTLAGGNGMHHLSFRVANLDDALPVARQLGYEAPWYHRINDEIAVAYLERPGDPLVVELTERPWDGGNIRRDGIPSAP